MRLEGLDDALSVIAAMDVGRDTLVPHLPRVFNSGCEVGTDLIVNVVPMEITYMDTEDEY